MKLNKDTPLTVIVEKDVLTIHVGIDVVKWAAENMDENNVWNEAKNDYIRQWEIVNPSVFSEEVRREMNDEEEDGTTPLILFLDKMCLAAIENGALGVDDYKTNMGGEPEHITRTK